MHISIFQPHPVLAPHIEKYVLLEFAEDETAISKLVPRSCPAIFFMSGTDGLLDLSLGDCPRLLKKEQIYIGGLSNQPGGVHISGPITLLMVMLKVQALSLFFKDKASLLANKIFNIGETDRELQLLNEQMWCHNIGTDLSIRLVDNYFLGFVGQSAAPPLIIRALNTIQARQGFVSVNEIADKSFSCNRNLSRRFQEHIGVSPKKYSTMIRFNAAMEYYIKIPNKNLDAVLQRFPFYDHSHLNKEFFKFMGNNPSSFNKQDLSINKLIL